MKAAQLDDYGPADNIRIVDVPQPKPGPGQVLVKVAYGGLRFAEIGARKNKGPTPTPFILGSEVSGVIEAVGPDVTGFSAGDRVMAQPANGGYAEYVAVDASKLTPVPDRVPLESALLYRINGIAAYLMVFEWAKVRDGETVLLHGAAGGVGRLVTQFIKRKLSNVTVIGLTGSDEKARAALAAGADHAVNYRSSDYVAEVEKITGGAKAQGGGVDVIFNGVGGPSLENDPKLLKKFGRWVIFGRAAGTGPIDVFPHILDSITVLPHSMLTFMGTPAMERANAFLAAWMADEDIDSPVIHPLEDIAKVHAAMERGETQGKIVFKI